MINKTRVARLTKLAYMLRNHKELFPQNTWDMNRFCMRRGQCGFAACALGSAALYRPFMRAGLIRGMGNAPTFEGRTEYEAGERFFHISSPESYWLFGPWNYRVGRKKAVSDRITTTMVARRVEKLIKHYQLNDGPLIHDTLRDSHTGVSHEWASVAVPVNTKTEDYYVD